MKNIILFSLNFIAIQSLYAMNRCVTDLETAHKVKSAIIKAKNCYKELQPYEQMFMGIDNTALTLLVTDPRHTSLELIARYAQSLAATLESCIEPHVSGCTARKIEKFKSRARACANLSTALVAKKYRKDIIGWRPNLIKLNLFKFTYLALMNRKAKWRSLLDSVEVQSITLASKPVEHGQEDILEAEFRNESPVQDLAIESLIVFDFFKD